MTKKGKRVIITLNNLQEKALIDMMKEDLETNRSSYVGRLITQEYVKRTKVVEKRPVGRPKKEVEVEDKNMYPAPYEGGVPFSRQDFEMYYEFRNQEIPPLPDPLTEAELKKYYGVTKD